MQDERIVELYWQRDESAIHETEQKYGPYLTKIAYNILSDLEDSKESVNDTYMGDISGLEREQIIEALTENGNVSFLLDGVFIQVYCKDAAKAWKAVESIK